MYRILRYKQFTLNPEPYTINLKPQTQHQVPSPSPLPCHPGSRCRANSVHIRQSRPDSGLARAIFSTKGFKSIFRSAPPFGSGVRDCLFYLFSFRRWQRRGARRWLAGGKSAKFAGRGARCNKRSNTAVDRLRASHARRQKVRRDRTRCCRVQMCPFCRTIFN